MTIWEIERFIDNKMITLVSHCVAGKRHQKGKLCWPENGRDEVIFLSGGSRLYIKLSDLSLVPTAPRTLTTCGYSSSVLLVKI